VAFKTLKHLSASLARKGANGAGACFYRAAALVLDHPPAKLCIGILAGVSDEELKASPNGAQEDFIHAWAEVGDKLYAPSLLSEENSNMGPFNREEYYQGNGVRDVRRISRADLLKMSAEYGLAAHLKSDAPLIGNRRFVQILLDASEIPFVVEDGLVLPAERRKTTSDD
jgi:hypothetical protein